MGENTSFFFNVMDYADPRMKKIPLFKSPYPVLWILVIYLICVFQGPKYMQHRQPFQLKTILLIYNPIMSVLNGLSVYFTISKYLTRQKGSFVCMDVDRGESEDENEILWLGFFTILLKIFELADTIFLVLRKKNSQMSFLHVYHHSTVVIIIWVNGLLFPGGQVWFVIAVNSSVHVVMYAYYALAAIGPHMQRYLWWKRYLTVLQLTQFVLVVVHCTLNHFAECNFPKLYNKIIIPYMCTHLVLFMHFYYTTYKPGKSVNKKD